MHVIAVHDLAEQFGLDLAHGMGERDARGHAEVIFQHVPAAFIGAHQVHAADLRAHRADWLQVAIIVVVGCSLQVFFLDDARGHNLLWAVHVIEECIECLRALFQACGEERPSFLADNAGNEIHRENLGFFFPGDAESNAFLALQFHDLLVALFQLLQPDFRQLFHGEDITRPRGAVGKKGLIPQHRGGRIRIISIK